MLLCTCFAVISIVKSEEYVTYSTSQGNIRGLIKSARNGDSFNAFLGVPFARPPIGDLRWQPPQPSPKWEGTLDATKMADVCTQDSLYEPAKMDGSEDCLYLNVFTKGKGLYFLHFVVEKYYSNFLISDEKKQVIVWIHGGAFIFGGINIYNPEYIMEENVVLVTIQYRLNVFGFMSTEDPSAPGNYGSLDQVAALKWIQANIQSFGGDPNAVTIFGMSAGGASVHYLTLSPLTKHLYKNAVSLSGSALCWWANVPHPRQKSITLGHHFKCPTDLKDMVECLRQVPSKKLHQAHYDLFFHWHKDSVEREPMNVFSPRSDPEAGPEAFLPEHPFLAMQIGNINPQPHWIGFTDKEGIWRANQLLPDNTERSTSTWKDFVTNFTTVAPYAFGLFGNQCKNPDAMVEKLQKFYNLDNLDANAEVTDKVAHNVIDVLSDTMFNYAIDTAAKMRAKHKHLDTYYHYYTFSGTHSLANLALDESIRRPPLAPLRRASHGADMLQLFKMFEFQPMPDYELAFSRKFIKLLIDWGKEGKPPAYLSEWSRLDLDNPKHLVIDEEFVVKEGFPDHERMGFWRTLDPVYWSYVLQKHTLHHDEL